MYSPGERNLPPDPTNPPGHFRAQPLGPGLRAPQKRPGLLADLIYGARLHSLSGPPEAGKTVLCMYLAVQAMQRHRPVLFVDEEAGPVQTTSILAGLGADAELIDKYLTYLPFPGIRLNDTDLGHLHNLVASAQPALVVFDSSAAMMSVAGIDENDAIAVTRFWYDLLAPLANNFGCSVLITDHDSKGTETSRNPRGSVAKLAATDVQFKLWPTRPFSREQDGLLRLSITKDRPGWLHRHYQIRVSRDPLSLDLMKAAEPSNEEKELPPISRQLLSVITDEPAALQVLNDRLWSAVGHRHPHKALLGALEALVTGGLADRMDCGPGRPVLWCKPQPQLPLASSP